MASQDDTEAQNFTFDGNECILMTPRVHALSKRVGDGKGHKY